ncbi:unnamed protein product [Orchesella dallaii]|uniref:Uncharacterized protein n=1 Tax=Orchesella dallaii TaxID=48710 RepID=A0ABP1Q171_9HEXA
MGTGAFLYKQNRKFKVAEQYKYRIRIALEIIRLRTLGSAGSSSGLDTCSGSITSGRVNNQLAVLTRGFMTFVSSVRKFGNSVRKAVKKTFFKVSKMTGRAGSYGVGSEGRGRAGNRRGADPQELSRQVSSLAIDTPDEPAIGRLAHFSGRGMVMRGAPQTGQRSPTPSSATSESGRDVHLISNHFELRWVGGKEGPKKDGESFTVHQYHITFEPEDLPQHIRRKVLNLGLDQETNGPFVYDGGALLFSTDMVECGMILESVPESDNHYKAIIAYTKAVPLDHPIYLQIYNLVVRKCLFGMGLDEIGKSYFDSAAVIDHANLKIKLWPGTPRHKSTDASFFSEFRYLIIIFFIYRLFNSSQAVPDGSFALRGSNTQGNS